MTPSPNEMSDEELEKAILEALQIDIVVSVENSGLKLKSAEIDLEAVLQLIKQHREAYTIEARIDELAVCNDMCVHASLGETYQVEEMIQERIAELRKKVDNQ